MGTLNVLFEIPEHLQLGLSTGILERIGGVVRDSNSKEVVAWLRDTGLHTETPTLFEPLLNVGSSVSFAAANTALNLAFSAASFVAIMARLAVLQNSINKLSASVLKEFKRDRDNVFRVALETAEDAYHLEDENQRNYAARQAIEGLKLSRNDFFQDFKEALEKSQRDRNYLDLARHLLIRAAYAQMSIARCYLVTDNRKLAIRQFEEFLPEFRSYSEQLIRVLLSPAPARYFEPRIPQKALRDFFSVQQWLRGDSGPLQAEAMLKIRDELRADFWNNSIWGNPLQRMAPVVEVKQSKMLRNLHKCLDLAESYQRLEGFQLEMESMRLVLDEWDHLVSEEDLTRHGGAIIVDEAALEEAAMRLQ